jgi:YgiT-type zinc finger domain-containing protein
VICLICRQAELVNAFNSVTFERDEMRLVVNHVPARICPSCREAYVDEDVAVQLLRDAERISASGEMDGVIEYNEKR